MPLDRVRDSLWSTTPRHVGQDSFHLSREYITTSQSIISDLLNSQQRKRSTFRAHFIWPCFVIDSSLKWGDERSLAPLHSINFPLRSGDVKLLRWHSASWEKKFKRGTENTWSLVFHTLIYVSPVLQGTTPSPKISTLSQMSTSVKSLVAWPSLPSMTQQIMIIQWQYLM